MAGKKANPKPRKEQPEPMLVQDRFYGAFWLLEQIAVECGLFDDLEETFDGNVLRVQEVLSLAFFPFLSGRGYSRFAGWQSTHKTLLECELSLPAIQRLIRSLSEWHTRTLSGQRLARQPGDLAPRPEYGISLVEGEDTVEACVYSFATLEPVYVGSFPGSLRDLSWTYALRADLQAVGISDALFMADRERLSEEGLTRLAREGWPFLVRVRGDDDLVAPLLSKVEYDENGLPRNMAYDRDHGLFYMQHEIPSFESGKANLFLDPIRRTRELIMIREEAAGKENLVSSAPYCGFSGVVQYGFEADGLGVLQRVKDWERYSRFLEQGENQMPLPEQEGFSEEEPDGWSFLFFVGLIPLSRLYHTWKEKLRDVFESPWDMLDEMESIRCLEGADGRIRMSAFTLQQAQICMAVGVKLPQG